MTCPCNGVQVGATDFEAFDSRDGWTYIMAANEQDDELGGDVESTLWRLAPVRSAPGNKDEL